MHSRDDVYNLLNELQAYYGRTLVAGTHMLSRLPLLRVLEATGFVHIKQVMLELHWVSTPAGAIWCEVERRQREHRPTPKYLQLNKGILLADRFAWMPIKDAEHAIHFLVKEGFVYEYLAEEINAVQVIRPTDTIPGAAFARRFS